VRRRTRSKTPRRRSPRPVRRGLQSGASFCAQPLPSHCSHKKEELVRRSVLVLLVFGLVAASAAIAAAATGGLPNIGKPSMQTQLVYKGYYDHHIDTYLITDVSSKSQAKAMHVNYSRELKSVKGLPEQYFVKGRAAKGQLTSSARSRAS